MYLGMGVIWTTQSSHKFHIWILLILELTAPRYFHVCCIKTFTISISWPRRIENHLLLISTKKLFIRPIYIFQPCPCPTPHPSSVAMLPSECCASPHTRVCGFLMCGLWIDSHEQGSSLPVGPFNKMYLMDTLIELSTSSLKQLGMRGMKEWGWGHKAISQRHRLSLGTSKSALLCWHL